jgi:hypothetical protein
MPKLSDLLAEKTKAELDVGGAKVEFVFYILWRERFSDEEWTAILASEGREYLKMLLPRVLASWNIVDDDEHAIPVTAEAIDGFNVPTALLFAIERRALGSDLSGKALNLNNSRAT